MEFQNESEVHSHGFLSIADCINNIWRRRQKAGKFDNNLGSRLLPSALSTELSSGTIALEI